MSSDGPPARSQSHTPSPAINVGFSSIGDNHAESSSRAESASSGKRSHGSARREEASQLTPPSSVSRRGDGEGASGGSVGRRMRKSGGFLLDSVFANGSPRGPDAGGKRKAQDGHAKGDERRITNSRLSRESSHRSSPLSREYAVDGSVDEEEQQQQQQQARATSMDTTQLVQMALNLSESRKRHVSNTLHVPTVAGAAGRRVTSAPLPNYTPVRAVSGAHRRSVQTSEVDSRDSPASDRAGGEEAVESNQAVMPIDIANENVFYTFSPATLARAEKARKYFELASEHRRFLHSLPPLQANSSERTLGRPFNPIQSIRNRRVRAREKRPFSAPLETWQDPERVASWIDEVEAASEDPHYRGGGDKIHLPHFAGEDEAPIVDARSQQNPQRHRRTDTVGSVIMRPENQWTVEPIELLADAHWLEKADNKYYIEAPHGEPIFPIRSRRSMDTPRISVEMHRGREDGWEPGIATRKADESGKHSKRKRLLLPLATTDIRRHTRLISRSSSSASSSDDEEKLPKKHRSDENIGPLARHMQGLIAKDERGELSSPELASPDHWNAKPLPLAAGRVSIDSRHRDSLSRPERASLEVPRDLHRRARSADGRVGSVDNNMFSRDDDQGSEPASPVVARDVPSMGIDLSPPYDSRGSLDDDRFRGFTLPIFRSQSKERNKIERTDFAVPPVDGNLSPIMSIDSRRPRSSLDSQRVRHHRRQQTNDSVTSLQRLNTGSTYGTIGSIKESGSTVGRLLKGGRDRIGGLVFSDRFKNREKQDAGGFAIDPSRAASDYSDLDDDPFGSGRLRRRDTDRAESEDELSPETPQGRGRPKPKYHLSGLPSFTSSARDKRMQSGGVASTTSDPSKQRPQERIIRVAAPTFQLPRAGNSNPELASSGVDTSATPARKSYGLLAPAFNFPRRNGTVSSPMSPGLSTSKRHWSIYDYAPPEGPDRVAARDIARARALLLSSGIKAREIQRQADTPRVHPQTLSIAKSTINEPQPSEPNLVPLKEEHLVAARLLTTALSTVLASFESTLSSFQSHTAMPLSNQYSDLQSRLSEHLTKVVHETSDEADAFTIQLTTQQPQQTKQVDDAIDYIIRQRRRQWRLLRRVGFKVLEWFVLGVMWWIWAMVVLFNFGRRAVVAVWRFLRWMFVF